MWIGLDASRATAARRTGTENYARRLTAGLVSLGRERHRYNLYLRDAPADLADWLPSGAGVEARCIPFPRLWTHIRLSAELLRRPRPDVLFVPAHVLPLAHPLPSVVTVHDLGYRHFPQAHPAGQRLYLDWSTRFSARGASLVIADSVATRRDLAHFYNIPDNKVRVVYPGRDESLAPTDPAEVRARYDLPEGYVLHVGTLQPRKNLLRLMDAVAALHAQGQPARLVLAGGAGWLSEPILARARELGELVRVLNYVPDADLAGLYSGAGVFAFPSLYEGFGFPVLEAMACGTPVVCANTSSLPELAGDAALLVDPADSSQLAAALGRVLSDAGLRAGLVERGLAQAQRFSWHQTSAQVLRVLEEAASMGRASA